MHAFSEDDPGAAKTPHHRSNNPQLLRAVLFQSPSDSPNSKTQNATGIQRIPFRNSTLFSSLTPVCRWGKCLSFCPFTPEECMHARWLNFFREGDRSASLESPVKSFRRSLSGFFDNNFFHSFGYPYPYFSNDFRITFPDGVLRQSRSLFSFRHFPASRSDFRYTSPLTTI